MEMRKEIIKSKTPKSISAIIFLLSLSILPTNQDAHALSVEEVCNQPIFKLWKTQQANRLWSPTEETLSAERSGKLFTYNCFTFEEIDQFFSSHAKRIENAYFYPILEIKPEGAPEEDNDC
jgi:hypothetical protein